MSRRVGLAVLIASLAVALLPPRALGDEVVVFDEVMTWRHEDPASFEGRARGPGNWVTPVNYRDGRLMFRLEVSSKPSDRPMYAQVCLGQQGWQIESCSGRFDPQFATPGVYTTDLGAPSSWWSHGAVDWTNLGASTFPSFSLSDPLSDRLMQSQGCGAYCWDPAFGNIASHMPITVRATLVAVSIGSTFSGWEKYFGGPAPAPVPAPTPPPAPTPAPVPDPTPAPVSDPPIDKPPTSAPGPDTGKPSSRPSTTPAVTGERPPVPRTKSYLTRAEVRRVARRAIREKRGDRPRRVSLRRCRRSSDVKMRCRVYWRWDRRRKATITVRETTADYRYQLR